MTVVRCANLRARKTQANKQIQLEKEKEISKHAETLQKNHRFYRVHKFENL